MMSTSSAIFLRIDSNRTSLSNLKVGPREQSIVNALEANILQSNLKFTELLLDNCRNLTLDWILHDGPMHLNATDSKLFQHFILALTLFAYELGEYMQDWLSDKDICQWFGVDCNGQGATRIIRTYTDCFITVYFICWFTQLAIDFITRI